MSGFCYGLTEQSFALAVLLSSRVTVGNLWQKHLSQNPIKLFQFQGGEGSIL